MMEICQSHIMFVMLKGHGAVIYRGQYELLIWIIPVEHVDTIIKITLGIKGGLTLMCVLRADVWCCWSAYSLI